MKYILNSREMKLCDENTMRRRGMLSAVLMERAALATMQEIVKRYPNPVTKVLVVCGSGNNGGDGVAVARLLYLKGYNVTIYFAGNREKATEETKRQMFIAEQYGVKISDEYPKDIVDVIVDALFGIGLSREVTGKYAEILQKMTEQDGYKVAVDIASGISADTGAVMGTAFAADLTVTFGFIKAGQLLYPGTEYTGELKVADIGIDEQSLYEIKPDLKMLEISDLNRLPRRVNRSNKGSYGKLLILAGSKQMAGAAVFAAKAAYRMGCGLVRVATVEENRMILQEQVPEAVLAVYNNGTDVVEFVETQLHWADAVVAGPGIGQSDLSERMLYELLKRIQVPCLCDADALNLLSKHPDWWKLVQSPLVITPHLGEMARLTGRPITEIRDRLVQTAQEFAMEHQITVVLKDARTITAQPDGQSYINVSGNHGMATAGAGDVLSGVVGALLAQKLDMHLAAALGVFIHGLAGDAAAERVGHCAMMASDIVDGLMDVLRKQEDTKRQ
ncbi:NAD(P)H-hydrate dehydratase [uncultured Eubacterium sp.]|uniref:NAD(P)H-hydrate dehydratase n=1 Tax=uncultured Eubacterium sp. TaxID=165185 RepID=UPI002591B03E|nr:NAD(P)H-hydrate dehydratase [uncultured Eubacterium sp.]